MQLKTAIKPQKMGGKLKPTTQRFSKVKFKTILHQLHDIIRNNLFLYG